MANKSENADIRELQTQMIDVNKNIEEVKQDVKSLIVKFDEQKNLQTEVDHLKEEVVELKKRRTFISIVVPIMASVLTALLTFLVISFFSSVGKVDPNKPSTTSTTTNTTTTTPGGSSSGTAPSASANANAKSDTANPSSSDSENVVDGVVDQIKKVTP